MKIERIDHLNITVSDIDRSIAFYERVLGMRSERMSESRAALLFGQQKVHLDLAGSTAMSGEKRMPAHICFITETPIETVKQQLGTNGVSIRVRAPAPPARSSRSISTIPT
jgi:catechol 2,3-dioxygenase-like lactoylglutathione lyase family enzyme